MSINIISLALLVPVILSGILLFHLWRIKPGTGSKIGIFLIMAAVLGSGISCLAYSAQLMSPDLASQFRMAFFRYCGNILFLLGSLFYCLWFTNQWNRISTLVKGIICLPFILCLFIFASNPIHHLYYSEMHLVSFHGIMHLSHTNGPLYYLVQYSAVAICCVTFILFVIWKTRSPRAYGPVVILVFLGFLSTVIGYFLYLAGFRPHGFLNLTSFSFFITSALFALAFIRYKAFSLQPIAHQMLSDTLPAGVIIYDNDLTIIEINPAARKMLNLKGSRFRQSLAEVFSPGDPVLNACSEKPSSPVQIQRDHQHIRLTFSPLTGYQGDIIGTLLLMVDTTEEKSIELQMKKAVSLLRGTIDAINDGILVIGTDRKIITANNQFYTIWEIPDSNRGILDLDLFLEFARLKVEKPESIQKTLTELLNNENTDINFIALLDKRTIEYYSSPFFVDGELIGRIYSFHDLTELISKEDALRESEAKYKIIIENAVDLIWTLNRDGIITYVSPSWFKILGYTPDETVGSDFRLIVHPEDTPPCEDYLLNSIEKREEVPNVEYRVLHADGTWHWHRAAGTSVFDSHGEFSSFIGVSRDINDQKFADLALKRANRQANLLSSITRHDILNQIMIILGYIEIAEDEPKSEAIRKLLLKIQDNTERIQTQIEFTRLYEHLGSVDPQWQPVSSLIRPDWIPPDISFTQECQGVSIFADLMLVKVFENLIDNSLRHGDHVSSIRISCQRRNEHLIIYYEDDGIGVPDTEKDEIFERGFGKHTGLGLYLVREILGITGVTIHETGEEGKGVLFEILVPSGAFRSVL